MRKPKTDCAADRKWRGLMMGVFLAMFVQTAYELLQHLKELIALVKAPNRPDHSTS